MIQEAEVLEILESYKQSGMLDEALIYFESKLKTTVMRLVSNTF